MLLLHDMSGALLASLSTDFQLQHLADRPALHGCLLLSLLLGTACLQCVGLDLDSEAVAAVKVCTRCRTARYCCVDCQAANWKPLHKATCSRLKAARAAAPAAQAAA